MTRATRSMSAAVRRPAEGRDRPRRPGFPFAERPGSVAVGRHFVKREKEGPGVDPRFAQGGHGLIAPGPGNGFIDQQGKKPADRPAQGREGAGPDRDIGQGGTVPLGQNLPAERISPIRSIWASPTAA